MSPRTTPIAFIRDHQAKPFLLVLGFKTRHGPFEPPPRHAQTFADELARTVPNLAVPAIYRRASRAASRPRSANPREKGPVKTNLGIFRCITAVDDNVGRLLKLLDDLGLAENTMVVFASDNGYYLGEHGLGDKRSAYEESLRIPLLVRYPQLGAKGRLVDQIALNIDLAPTLLDFAGVPVPKEMHGRSWRPLLEGQTPADWRRAFFYCYFFERNYAIPMVTAVRTETAKLIKYPGHDEWTEVFDLQSDPYELRNLAQDPASASLQAELEAEYEKQSAAIGFHFPTFADDPRQAVKEAKPRKRERVIAANARELIPYLADAVPGRIQATLTLGDTTHLSGKWHLGDKPD